jgi:hypothetical protein
MRDESQKRRVTVMRCTVRRRRDKMIGTPKELHKAQAVYDAMSEPEMSDDESGLRYLIEAAEALIGRAERCLDTGDIAAAIDLLQSAGKELTEAGYA